MDDELETPLVRSVDSKAYQTFFHVRTDGDLVERVEEQLGSWLRNRKAWDPPTGSTGFHNGPGGSELVLLHKDLARGRAFRARLSEPQQDGEWRSSITVHAPSIGDGWIGLRVSNSQNRFAAVPWLATYFLDALEARDADTWLSSAPRVIHPDGVGQLAEEIGHVDRLGLYFVAGTNEGIPVERTVDRMTTWTRQTVGLAESVILDGSATRAFNEIMGKSHEAPPGTVRTFQPGTDPAIAADGLRHKILGRSRLSSGDREVALLLGRIARRHASQQPRPRQFVAVHRKLERLENDLLIGSLEKTPSSKVESSSDISVFAKAPTTLPKGVGEGAEAYLAQIELVKSTLGLESLDYAALDDLAQRARQGADAESISRVTRELEERQSRIEDLEQKVEFYQGLYDEEQLDLAAETEQSTKLADEVRWLRRRLAEFNDPAGAFGALPAGAFTEYPADFSELHVRLPQLETSGVIFTGDEKELLSLDEFDTLGKQVRTAWDALMALCDYVKSRNEGKCDSGVKHYLTNTPAGFRTVPPKKFAESETSRTMDAWGDQRMFSVPRDVEPTGQAAMSAHFKLGRVGMVSPRLYYLDRWTLTGCCYVGYIGAHLRNTMTN